MTDTEIRKAMVAKWRANGAPSLQPRYARKHKLKARYAGRLVEEIRRTREKLDLLVELKTEDEQRQIKDFRP